MTKRMRWNGNSYQRRKLRRYLNRVAVPRILAGESVYAVAYAVNVSTQALYKHLHNEGIVQKAWMYRNPQKPEQAA